MHKEVRTTRASRIKRAAIGVFIVSAGFICFVLAHIRPATSASLKVLGFGSNQDGYFVMVQFSNTGPATICYPGYETNEPWYSFELETPAGPTPECPYPSELYPHAYQGWIDPRWFELKVRQSVDFQVWTTAWALQRDKPVYRVELDYFAPGRLDWFREHAQYSRTVLSQVVISNSIVTEAN